MGLAAHLYAADHDHVLPPDVDALLPFLDSANVRRCPANPRRQPPADDGGPNPKTDGVSYEFRTPGAKESEVSATVLFACPVHGSTVRGDGSVQPGPRPPPARTR